MHTHTPTLAVMDSRGLKVATVSYCREAPGGPIAPRIYRQHYKASGQLTEACDPRLAALHQREPDARPNLTVISSLTGVSLSSDSVDGALRLTLPGAAGQRLIAWDGLMTQTSTDYDLLLRPVSIVEHVQGMSARNSGFFSYGDSSPSCAARNQCGRIVRHDDSAGSEFFPEYSLTGEQLRCVRHFLSDLDEPDWPQALADRDLLHEHGSGAATHIGYNALNETISQQDATGNQKQLHFDVGGQLNQISLKVAQDSQPRLLLHDIQYNAGNQVLRQAAANGVISQNLYDPQSGRLLKIIAEKDGRPALQHLVYCYDPVGNILSVEDMAQPTRFFRNQTINPVSSFIYDSLYQLIGATGWQRSGTVNGPQEPVFSSPPDSAQLENYRQTYTYDAAGNLIALVHSAASKNWTQRTAISRYSNRGLEQTVSGTLPDELEISAGFDSNGNRKMLQPGQPLQWSAGGRLLQVDQVMRKDATNDCERYVYDGAGRRQRKIRLIQSPALVQLHETRYLPGLEIRHRADETLHVISVQAGRCAVEILHWDTKDKVADQYRYQFSNHLGSNMLVLDDQGNTICEENYFPYGGTSWWAGPDQVQARYKTRRYAGQELDATGLYYYGQRFYAPWLMRWISPDPVGITDGLNRYLMVRGNPVRFVDRQGLTGWDTAGAAGATATREFVSAAFAAAAQAAFVGVLPPTNVAVGIGGALAGAVTGGISGYAGANWAQSSMHISSPANWGPLAAKIGGAVIGAALGAAPSLLGMLDPRGNPAAAGQIGSAFGTLFREISAQYLANAGPSNPAVGRVDPLTGAASVVGAVLAAGATGFGGSVLFGTDATGNVLQSVLSVSAVTAASAAAASAVRGARGTPARPSSDSEPSFNQENAVVGYSSRHFFLSLGQIANLAVSQIPGYDALDVHTRTAVSRAVVSAVGDIRSTFVTIAKPGLSAELGTTSWDLEKNEVGAGIVHESPPADVDQYYVVSETSPGQRKYSRAQLNF
ncbi:MULTISPECIES: RHS repeat domain-containing protein [Pseudomonas]|uniref:RHS repeat domain-containing protein n=1 Tax=Pseudomonas TaxID=286 RepID=UPI00059E926F|nr:MULTISPECIES: RHS repeat-associated core domain-containing protein [Pseudomonas]AMT90278.1 type IV secretion protein Rhs [Pseudomonas koreensis]MBB4057135.1 RHS repeat-associated protein [Pseudomonas koreensis]TSB49040.1 RHS repeat protein [Pseudomonas sp. ef1]